MKIIIALIVFGCLSLSLVNSVEITTWGITDPGAILMGTESVFAERDNYNYQLRTIQFPMVSKIILNQIFPRYDMEFLFCSNQTRVIGDSQSLLSSTITMPTDQ